MEGQAMTYFADDGYLDTKCCWCGKPAADGEKIEVVQWSSREAMWMHLNCERLYSEMCKKDEEDFYANDVMKFVRGEPSGIIPGRLGEITAKIAKDLIGKNPSLALPENLKELMAAVKAVEHERAIADGLVITLSDEEIAMCERLAKERAALRGQGREK
jgi:hypothetical protein